MTEDITREAGAQLACTECSYIFTGAEIAAEDKAAWGHPCHGVSDPPGTVCESFRTLILDARPTEKPQVHTSPSGTQSVSPLDVIQSERGRKEIEQILDSGIVARPTGGDVGVWRDAILLVDTAPLCHCAGKQYVDPVAPVQRMNAALEAAKAEMKRKR